ncbi:MAG TPA: TIM barrel protein [Phycisphaerales bacterium]|nr:TIM barrel protein [Phycisphaerales bacterium]
MLLPASKGKKPALDMLDLPRHTREVLGLSGLTLSTDLLAGADRARLEAIRERADRAGAACLLLVEYDPQNFGSTKEADVVAATTRARKVVEAAQILGCSAAAIKVAAVDDDAAMARVAAALKPVVERAEKLDINLLISPHDGLTGKSERVTDLLKKVGGFRIGTYPDFQTAAGTAKPVDYLHRLTPYATGVCAATVKFTEPIPDEPAPKPSKKLAEPAAAAAPAKPGKGKAAKVQEDEEATPGGVAKKGKKAAPPPPVEVVEAEDEIDDIDDAELDAEIAALMGEALDDDMPAKLVALKHEPYDLFPLVEAIAAVGYDGPLAVDYRGTGDLTEGIIKSRDTLLALIARAKDKSVD